MNKKLKILNLFLIVTFLFYVGEQSQYDDKTYVPCESGRSSVRCFDDNSSKRIEPDKKIYVEPYIDGIRKNQEKDFEKWKSDK